MIRHGYKRPCGTERQGRFRTHRRGTALFELITYLVPLLCLGIAAIGILRVRAGEAGVSARVHRDVHRLATDPSWGGPTRRTWHDAPLSLGAPIGGSGGPAALSVAGLPRDMIGGEESRLLRAPMGVFGDLGATVRRDGLVRRQAWTWTQGPESYTQSSGDTAKVHGWFDRAMDWSRGKARGPLRLSGR